MNRRWLVYFLVLFVFFDLILGGYYFYISKGSSFLKEKVDLGVVVEVKAPVADEYLDTIPEYALGANNPVFFLPDQVPVKAVISGKVTYVGQKIEEDGVEFENVIIQNEPEKLIASYLFSAGSSVLVEKEDQVIEGDEIAKISDEKDGPDCLGGANLGVYLFKDGQPVRLSQDMFK